MYPEDLWKIILLLLCLIGSAFFSASETALMSLSKIRVRNMVDENIKNSHKVKKILENPSKLLSAILVGNNIVNIGASSIATSLAIEYFGNTGVGIATGIMTILVLIFGEITPKSLAAQNAEKVSLKVVSILSYIKYILNPITSVLMKITNTIIRILGGNVSKEQPFITEEELKTIINISYEEGVLKTQERKMINNVFEFNDTRVYDVMTQRVDLVAADINSSYDEIISIFKEEKFSRIPIYEGNIDNIVGVLYLKDLIFNSIKKESFDISNNIRTPYFAYESKRVIELFNEMKKEVIPIVIAMDEYGGTAGIVTMDDLVEEIVGDIQGEHDKERNEIEFVEENNYIVNGTLKIDVVNEVLGLDLRSDDFDSIGGFVTGVFERLPEIGEQVEYENIKFIVESTNRNIIENLRIIILE